jgi:glycosyltransferase involved in cell wall biosynthesis
MNIAFDCERMKYPHTGLFEYCHQLGIALKASLNPGDEIKYYVREDNKRYFEAGSTFLTQNTLHKFIFPRYSNIDLWHTTYQISSYKPQSKKIKKVITIHDLNFLYEERPEWKRQNYLKQHQQSIDETDHIIAISEFTKQDIIKNLNVAGKPISVIYNGCAKGTALPDTEPPFLPSGPFLFALGTVNPKKNFHVLIPLLANNDFELIIAGKTEQEYKNKIIDEAKKYGVANRVKVIGPVSEQEKSWYYKNCVAFLFPSIAEGFGIPPIEAMRFGKPTFLSNSTSLPEIGGDLAYYFNSYAPEDMQKVFNYGMNDYETRQPAAAIIRHAEQFDWDRSAKAYLEVYRKTMNG